ncbi:MAG: hypothetical protein H7145_12155 [Akkermansiaceae bacterium]|nr:hypothetical protein [Armatimonadota bacterium]
MATQEPPVQKKDGSVNEKVQHSPMHEQTSGQNQRNPHPNENIVNRPYSLSNEERFGDGTDANAKTESAGVTQGHSSPQGAKHGHGAEGGSSTGLPEGESSSNS